MISKIVLCTINLTTNFEEVTGGVDSAIINLLDGFSKFDKKRFYIISFTKTQSKIIRYQTNIILVYISYSFLFKSSKLNFICKAPFLFRKLILKIKPDIIHYQVHGVFLIVRIFLKKLNFNELNTFHGLYDFEALTKGNAMEARINNVFNNYLGTKNAIFISKFSANYFRKFNFNKTAIIPNSISKIFNVNSRFDTHDLTVTFVGLMSPLKNIELIIESLSLLKPKICVKCYIYGTFKSLEYEKVVLNKIEKYNLQEQFILKGFISRKELLGVLRNNNIVIVPSLHENLPMVIAESLIMNNIVIGSKIGGIPEMITHSVTGFLIDPYSPQKLCYLLNDIFTHKYDLKTIADNGKKFAIDHFLSDHVALKTLNFYDSISNS